MHPLMTEALAHEHRRALLADADRHRAVVSAPARHPLRAVVRGALALASSVGRGWRRAPSSCGPAECASTSGAVN